MSDISYFVTEVMKQRGKRRCWSASDRRLAGQVYERVKELCQDAELYEYDGTQYITTSKKQKEQLAARMALTAELYKDKISEIEKLISMIEGERYV